MASTFKAQLNPQAIGEINAAMREHSKSLSPGTVVGWLSTAGTLLSEYLPDFLEVLKALSSVSGTKPSVAMFFRKGAEMFQDSPEPDIKGTGPVDEEPKGS
jgi:hypothetical protein